MRLLSLCLLSIAQFCWAGEPAKEYDFQVINSFPHSTNSFTQGLEYRDGFLYEGTGKRGFSKISKRRLNSVRERDFSKLKKEYFGEGITVLDNKVYQLTWKAQRGFIYDAKSLDVLSTFTYKGDGWGLSNNGKELILSNGSDKLQFINPGDFSITRTTSVTLDDKPVSRINELEWINGHIYANIWQSNRLVIIEPKTGKVTAYVDLAKLLPKKLTTAKTDVLNGIAYDKEHQRLLVTGKYWPRIFHIELIDKTR